MAWESFVGRRYLMAKKRSSVVSIITIISVTGVALGVAALIVVLSVMGGFKKDLTDKILSTRAHMVARAAEGDLLSEPGPVADRIAALPGVVGAAPYRETEVMVAKRNGLGAVVLRGVDVARFANVSELPGQMQEGSLAYLSDPAPLEAELRAERERPSDFDGQLAAIEAEIEALRAKSEAEQGGEASAPSAPREPIAPIVEEGSEEPVAPIAEEEGPPPLFAPEDEEELELPGLLIGSELAKSLNARLGDTVDVVTPQGDLGPLGRMPRSRPFRIVGIFYTGMYEYDSGHGYARLEEVERLLAKPGASGIEVRTVDVDLALSIAAEVERLLGAGFEVDDWKELNRSLFFALELEKIAMFIVLTFIILVASFSIIAMLIMIVIEKGREVALLKALGATNAGVMRSFMFQGVVIGTVGTLLGLIGGLALSWGLAEIGFPLDPDVYYISTLPVEIDAWEIASVIVCAIGISVLATLYPSWQAARLEPIDGLRDD